MYFGYMNVCEHCGTQIDDEQQKCHNCGEFVNYWCECSKERCGNCHTWLGQDKYCRICGTKAGEGEYSPYRDFMECIYGPMPVKREHKCASCGYSWTTELMLDEEKYCPKCGGRAPYEGDYFAEKFYEESSASDLPGDIIS